ncbi:MAG: hypothetical protein QE271_04375 [Bacteriovoracaceae bacterium]|nr:hypothetical protein [Bacteriovoracaceae bacterium]
MFYSIDAHGCTGKKDQLVTVANQDAQNNPNPIEPVVSDSVESSKEVAKEVAKEAPNYKEIKNKIYSYRQSTILPSITLKKLAASAKRILIFVDVSGTMNLYQYKGKYSQMLIHEQLVEFYKYLHPKTKLDFLYVGESDNVRYRDGHPENYSQVFHNRSPWSPKTASDLSQIVIKDLRQSKESGWNLLHYLRSFPKAYDGNGLELNAEVAHNTLREIPAFHGNYDFAIVLGDGNYTTYDPSEDDTAYLAQEQAWINNISYPIYFKRFGTNANYNDFFNQVPRENKDIVLPFRFSLDSYTKIKDLETQLENKN